MNWLVIQYRRYDLYRLIAQDAKILSRLVTGPGEGQSEGVYRDYIEPDSRLSEAIAAARKGFPADIPKIRQYIYLTQAAAVVDDLETTFQQRDSLVDLYAAMAKAGDEKDIDHLMETLESDTESTMFTAKAIDYALGLVGNPVGVARIHHYLLNGTKRQRNYAALYCKRRGSTDRPLLEKAVKLGAIDKIQAFSS